MDFFEKNARESKILDAVKALSPDKEKSMELALKEIRLELKQQSKRLKEVEKKAERCISNIGKEEKKIDDLDKSVSEVKHMFARLRKKVKKQHNALKLVEQIFFAAAAQRGTIMPGEKFEQFAKRCIKSCLKDYFDIKRIDSR